MEMAGRSLLHAVKLNEIAVPFLGKGFGDYLFPDMEKRMPDNQTFVPKEKPAHRPSGNIIGIRNNICQNSKRKKNHALNPTAHRVRAFCGPVAAGSFRRVGEIEHVVFPLRQIMFGGKIPAGCACGTQKGQNQKRNEKFHDLFNGTLEKR